MTYIVIVPTGASQYINVLLAVIGVLAFLVAVLLGIITTAVGIWCYRRWTRKEVHAPELKGDTNKLLGGTNNVAL